MDQQVVLITGASRGFGAAAARKIAERGHIVVATMRSPDRDGPAVSAGFEDRIQIARLDVTDAAEVEHVVSHHARAARPHRRGGEQRRLRAVRPGRVWPRGPALAPARHQYVRPVAGGPGRPAVHSAPDTKARSSTSPRCPATSSRRCWLTTSRRAALEALSEGLRFEVGDLACRCASSSPACSPATGGPPTSTWPTALRVVYGELVATRFRLCGRWRPPAPVRRVYPPAGRHRRSPAAAPPSLAGRQRRRAPGSHSLVRLRRGVGSALPQWSAGAVAGAVHVARHRRPRTRGRPATWSW